MISLTSYLPCYQTISKYYQTQLGFELDIKDSYQSQLTQAHITFSTVISRSCSKLICTN